MKLHDISLEIREGMITYPGDTIFKSRLVKKIPRDSSNVSEYLIGAHTGTHLDSQSHIDSSGRGVDSVRLEECMGPCTVLDLRSIEFGEGVQEKHLCDEDIAEGTIVLLQTKNSSTGYHSFRKDFIYLSEEGAKYLLGLKVKAVGIDYLSIQKYHTGRCVAHCILLEEEIPIFEGLDLSAVEPGNYFFIGLPLKIKGGDGSPVRAVLVEGGLS